MAEALKVKRILVFSGWYPSPEAPASYLFVQQQVRILNQRLPALTGAEWKFVVWNEIMATDLFNHTFRRKAQTVTWNDNGIPVLRRQRVLLSHHLHVDQDEMILRKMAESYDEAVKSLGCDPDLVWCVTLSSAVLWDRFRQRMNLTTPFILQEHSVPLTMHLRKPWSKARAVSMLERVSKVVVVAERQVKEFRELESACAPKLVWNAVSEDFLSLPNGRPPKQPFTFLFVGRLSPQKGLGRLISAAKWLRRKSVVFVIRIVGNGEDEAKLRSQVEAADLSENFFWMGLKTSAEISAIMDACHAFVLPSLYENCPVALLEAQTKGLPCICTINGASERVLLPGNGIAVDDRGEGEELAMAMVKMVMTYGTYPRDEIRQRSIDQFGPDVFADKMARVFSDVLK